MPTAASKELRLPDARHSARLPSELSAAQVERIRQAAYTLPQVVAPADLAAPGSAGSDAELDDLGYVLLQKAVADQRPSRWIAPADMTVALQHLDAMPTGAARAR